jgi:NADPH:quinone reductase-like Zn-dependent oxidoreductase
VRAFAYKEFGGEGSVQELPIPEPGEREVRVKVDAAAFNPMDVFVVKGYLKDRAKHEFPLVPGLDFAGTVDAVGPGVEGLKNGDPVFGVVGKNVYGRGSMGEYVIASAATVAKRPADLDSVKGAALPLAGVSALMCVEAAAVKSGDKTVVVGAGGGIGSIAVQLAAKRGAHVIGVASGEKESYVRGLGAKEFIDYRNGNVAAAIKSAHPDGVEAIIDTISDATGLTKLLELVRRGGHVVSMRGSAAVEELEERGIKGTNVSTQANRENLGRLIESGGGGLKVDVKSYPLDRAGEALDELAAGHARGKLVITVR